jgi:hypothetical protein
LNLPLGSQELIQVLLGDGLIKLHPATLPVEESFMAFNLLEAHSHRLRTGQISSPGLALHFVSQGHLGTMTRMILPRTDAAVFAAFSVVRVEASSMKFPDPAQFFQQGFALLLLFERHHEQTSI